MRFLWRIRKLILCSAVSCLLLSAAQAFAQLNQNCVVSVLNRTVQVSADGTWVLPNIPANFGPVRARATCVNGGVTTFGQSAFFTIPANNAANVPPIILGSATPIPESIAVTSPATTLTAAGAVAQLAVTAAYADGTTQDVTAAAAGTLYNISNPAIATVTVGGLVTAVSSGTAVIQAVNEGRQGIVTIQVTLAGVSHGGIPDSWALAHGLDPTDPAMPMEDPDHDGLTNLQEFQAGTDPQNPDTDGDGLTDGQEVLVYHTNPTLFSTDGTGISDGIEVKTATLNATLSAKLAAAIQSLSVTPANFVLNVNAIQGLASQQLTVTALLIDGKTTLNLTSTLEGTNYASSDLTRCNFGAPDGNVFAGNDGSCTITVTNNGFSAQATAVVHTFTPAPLSFVAIPGFANEVAVNGNYAFVAAGGSGLQVVDVSDRTNPHIVGSLALSGNANDVKLLGNTAYVASGSAGLQVVDVTSPLSPALAGSFGGASSAVTTTVRGTTAYIASGSNLVVADVTNPASIVQLSSLALSGTLYGTDVDTTRKIAAVTAGYNGLYLVDITNPAAPAVLGNVPTGDARAVALRGNYAYVADYVNSTTSVDITNPANPVVLSNITDPNLGGYLQDIQLSGNFGLAADVKFVNGIPITDITNPSALIARQILSFPQRDDNGMGIAVDGTYAYLATEHYNLDKFGVSGDSRLYIGQYLAMVDNKGIPPTAAITFPVNGANVIAGSVLPITVSASDDVAVASVNFLVNGALVFTATAPPYQFNYTVPAGVATLTLGATAVDLGGNIGTAKSVLVGVVPDPLTTVTGTVVDSSSQPVAGATVTVFGSFTAATGSDGTFSISSVPTVRGQITAQAQATIGGKPEKGSSRSFVPIPAGQTAVGNITLRNRAVVGYYDLSYDAGNPDQVGPITTAGLQAADVGDLTAADLTQFDILFIQNPDNSGYSQTFLNNLAKVQQFIANGGVMIFHDRCVNLAGTILPGSPGTTVRDFSDSANIDIVDNSTLVTNGPGGIITNASLDGGNASSHGWTDAKTIPAGSVGILSQTNSQHLVTYSYPYQQGSVIYSTIPLDFYLQGNGYGTLNVNMAIYAANVVAYAATLP